MFHFNQIEPWHVDELLTMLIMSLVYFGLPTLVLSALLGFCCRRLRTWHVRSSLPVVGLLFGLVTGYFAVWAGHHWHRFSPQDFHWTEPLTLFAAPGDAMANSYGGDWQEDEAWHYRGDITALNGLFWMGIGTASMFLVQLVARALPTARQDSNERPGGDGGTTGRPCLATPQHYY
jgi:hypothetical protein